MGATKEVAERELTYGEKAVGINFNMGVGEEFDEIDACKMRFAMVINQINDLRNSSESQEQKRLCSIAITEIQGAQMWAVKAITWKD